MGAIAVVGVVLVLLPVALGYQGVLFLQENAVAISLVFWVLLGLFSYMVGKRESNAKDSHVMYCFPAAFIPSYVLLFSSLEDLAATSGFDLLFLPITLVLSLCFTFGVGLGVWVLCTKIPKPALASVTTVVSEIFVTAWILSI